MIEGPVTGKEVIVSASNGAPEKNGPAGVDLCTFVSEACGAAGLSTGIAKFRPAAHLPYHFHSFSEAVTVLEGHARFVIEGRAYRLGPQDCVHIPSGVAYMVQNEDPVNGLIAHWAFATAKPSRELTYRVFPKEELGSGNPPETALETIIRFDNSTVYELSNGAFFMDLFARRFGSVGICGGHGRFLAGASLPCHIHDFDESITIVKGTAVCMVQGRQYESSNRDTAFIPTGIPHRFLNRSNSEMAMIWVYAGSEPDRRIVEAGYCSGELVWPGAAQEKKD